MQTRNAERRCAERFQVDLPVSIDRQLCSLTQLSPRGLLLLASLPPALGKTVDLQLRYEAEEGGLETVSVTGEILRVEVRGGAFHVAVQLNEALF